MQIYIFIQCTRTHAKAYVCPYTSIDAQRLTHVHTHAHAQNCTHSKIILIANISDPKNAYLTTIEHLFVCLIIAFRCQHNTKLMELITTKIKPTSTNGRYIYNIFTDKKKSNSI